MSQMHFVMRNIYKKFSVNRRNCVEAVMILNDWMPVNDSNLCNFKSAVVIKNDIGGTKVFIAVVVVGLNTQILS